MEKARALADSIAESFWTSEHFKETVFGVRLLNSQPYTNVDFPFQLVINFFNKGPGFLADNRQEKGGVHYTGYIAYGNGMYGDLIDKDTIKWQGLLNGKPIYWKRVVQISENKDVDHYDAKAALLISQKETDLLQKQLLKAYPYKPGVQGL